jgi:hypothetical protein
MVQRKPDPPPQPKRVPKYDESVRVRYNSTLSREFEKKTGSSTSSGNDSDQPLTSVARSFSVMAIFVVFIIIMVNFVIIFSALVIVTPELLTEHHAEMQSEIPFELDNSIPIIRDVTITTSNSTYMFNSQTEVSTLILEQGEIFKINLDAFDNNLAEVTASISSQTSILKYLTVKGFYQIYFAAPITTGTFELELNARDLSGNGAEFIIPLQVISTEKPVIYLTNFGAEFILHSGSIIKANVLHDETYQIEYIRTDPQLRVTSSALNSPYLISTSGWLEGLHSLVITAFDGSGNSNTLSYIVTVDNKQPDISKTKITSLTPDRKNVFGLKLPENNYYRGEIVKISARVSDPNIKSVGMEFISNRKFPTSDSGEEQKIKMTGELKFNPNSYEFELITSLPTKAAKYQFNLTACDYAGNNCSSEKTEISVAEITYEAMPVPIIELNSPFTSGILSPTSNLTFSTRYGDIDKLSYTYSNGTTELSPGTLFFTSDLEAGNYTLKIHSTRSWYFYDYVFITLPLPPFLFGLFPVYGLGIVIFFFFIASVIIISTIMLLRNNGKDYLKKLSNFMYKFETPSLKSNNAIILIAQFFLAILFLNVLYSLILSLFEITPHVPAFGEQPTWMQLYNFASASAWEEIISRTLLIGVPLLFFHVLLDCQEKPGWKYLIGGNFKLKTIPVILIIFSALVFGFAHSPGWDYWKVFTSTVSGLAFGYLFLRKGLYASVILHFTINYLTMPLQVAGDPPVLVLIFDIVLFLMIFIGAMFFIYYIKRIYEFLTKQI